MSKLFVYFYETGLLQIDFISITVKSIEFFLNFIFFKKNRPFGINFLLSRTIGFCKVKILNKFFRCRSQLELHRLKVLRKYALILLRFFYKINNI